VIEKPNTPMHVAYLVNQYPKVSHTFVRREIMALERQGVTVSRFALRGWDAEVVDDGDKAEQTKTTYTLKDGLGPLMGSFLRRAVRQPGAVWGAVKAALGMAKNGLRPWPYHLVYVAHACRIMDELDTSPVTHLHAHFGTNSAEIAALVKLLGGPSYSFTIHGMDEADNAKRLGFDHKVGHAKFVVAISAYTRSQLLRHITPSDWHKIKVVHCGLPARAFADAETPLPKTPVFLCIGRLSGEKGHLILLDAFAEVLKKKSKARLVLAGDGDLREVIEEKIATLGIGNAVRITGWISSDQVRDEIVTCNVLVQPSFIEGLPVVIMEAMAQRRPVISTYVAGIPELVRPGESGWLVPAGNIDDLAAAMVESMATPTAKMRTLGRNAATRAQARHNIDTEAAKLKALLAQTGSSEA
jgi:colanic acid/amylovoran biosynthesis glycosyltransferase